MIQLSDISFAYGKRLALSDLSLKVQAGEFLGVLGPNSSGKSTLLKIMSKELAPARGTIELIEKPLAAWTLQDLARTVTVVSSEDYFSFPFTVEQIVLMGRTPYVPHGRRETVHDHAVAEEAMQATDVIALRDRSIHELSSGERQRVLLARALTQEPRVLLLDEPTVHLDIGHAWAFFDLLKRLHTERNLTVVCALHDLSLAEAFCSRLIMLREGRIHTQGSPQEVLTPTTLQDVFGVPTRKESIVKKWIPAVLIMLLSTLSLKGFCAMDAEATTPASTVTSADLNVPGSPQDVFVTLTRTAISDKDLPFNTETVQPAQFQTYDALNAGDAVSRMTSVNVPSQGQLGSVNLAGIRGASSNQTLVMIDGRPVGGVALSGSQDLSEIPTEQIDHIEVVRGGVSALYGPNALGGVINIITKRSTNTEQPVMHIGFEDGSYARQAYRLDFGARSGPVDYFLFGDQQAQSGFRDNSDVRSHNLGGNVGLAMGGAGKLTLDLANYHADAGVPGQLFTDIPPNQFNNVIEKQSSSPLARQQTDTTYLRTSYAVPLPMESLATLRAFGSEREVQYDNPDPFATSHTDRVEWSKGGEAQFNLPLGLLAGGNFIRDRLDSRDLVTPGNNYIAGIENYGIFLQEDFHWGRLTLIPSGRYDHNSVAGEAKSPRVQTIVDATDWLRFSGSAARSFRAPTIDDLYTPFTDFGFGFSYVGNPNLRPERAWTYDAGFELHEDSCSLKVGYFRSNITDLIQTTPDDASTTVNVGHARRQGMEIEIAHAINRYVQDSWNYTYLQNVGIPGPDFTHPAPFTDYVTLRLSPRHTVNYIATIKPLTNWSLDNTVRYVSSSFEGNGESGTKIGDYFLWGMRVSYQLHLAKLYFGADDLTNKRYEERGGYPLPGRTFYGGVSVKI